MSWGGMSVGGRTDLYPHIIWNRILMTQSYANDIHTHAVTYTAAIRDPFLLMHDNARLDTARSVGNVLGTET